MYWKIDSLIRIVIIGFKIKVRKDISSTTVNLPKSLPVFFRSASHNSSDLGIIVIWEIIEPLLAVEPALSLTDPCTNHYPAT